MRLGAPLAYSLQARMFKLHSSKGPFAVVAAMVTIGCGHGDSGSSPSGTTSQNLCKQVRGLTNLLQGPSPLPGNFGPSLVISDEQYVYFDGPSSLYRVPISSGPAETVYSGAFSGLFAAKGGTVAWVQGSFTDPTSLGVTVKNANGLHSVVLPAGAVPAYGAPLVDAEGNVFFDITLQSGGSFQTWRWDQVTDSAAEMPGVGMPDGGGVTNLYWADRGQIIWAENGGVYVTDVSTGAPRQLVDSATTGFGTPVGLDASNLYGAGSICPRGACPFTIYGVSRNGGTPFVAYETAGAYQTEGLQADDSGLYWIDWQTFAIYHAALSKGAPTELVFKWTPTTGSTIPSHFALDACNLYWTEGDQTGGLRVMAIPK